MSSPMLYSLIFLAAAIVIAGAVLGGLYLLCRHARPYEEKSQIVKLVEFGYLRPAKRHREGVVERAMERLSHALQRKGVICEGDLSRDMLPAPNKVLSADDE
jgi:hypothetical protein